MNNRGLWKGLRLILNVLFYSSLGVFISYLLVFLVLAIAVLVLGNVFRGGSGLFYTLFQLVLGLGTPVALLGASVHYASEGVCNNCIGHKEGDLKLVPWIAAAGYLMAHVIAIAILRLIIWRDPIESWMVWLGLAAVAIGSIATLFWVSQKIKGTRITSVDMRTNPLPPSAIAEGPTTQQPEISLAPSFPPLALEENRILELLAQGQADDEIAKTLSVPASHVFQVKVELLHKFGVNRDEDMVWEARKRGCLQ